MSDAIINGGPNTAEALHWATSGGQKWVEYQQVLDCLFGVVTEVLLESGKPKIGEKVIDLGCGAGETTLAFAKAVGGSGFVTGVDISPLLLGVARRRAALSGFQNTKFLEADAQIHVFETSSYDLLISRFGSMFFSDPAEAFANLRMGMRSGGRLLLAAWGPLSANPWFDIPRTAAIARLGPGPAAPANQPGPFAFSDQDYAVGLLNEAGLADVRAESVSVELIAPDSVDEAAELAVILGPAGRLLAAKNGTAQDAAAISKAVRAAFLPYNKSGGVKVPATLNLFSARCP